MNKIVIQYGETTQPRKFESRKYSIQIEKETTNDMETEAVALFNLAKAIVNKQKSEQNEKA